MADQKSQNQTISIAEIILTSIPRAPWRGFVFGVFLPLVTLQAASALKAPIFGLFLSLATCILFCLVDTVKIKKLSLFPVITFFMILTQSLARFWAAKHNCGTVFPVFVMTVDNLVIAIFFLGSLFGKTPLILMLLDDKTLESIPEKIRASSYYLGGWRLVTLLWGALYVAQPFLFVFLEIIHLPGREAIDYILGWPVVAVFLVLSVVLPRWYWSVNMKFIDKEALSKRG